MSDLKKLDKQVAKAKETVEARRSDLDQAIQLYGDAVGAHAIALEAFENTEALETARELRSKGK